jgi:nitroreductase
MISSKTSSRTSPGTPTPSTQVSVAHALVAAAAMAPSILNTQPWSFDIRDRAIELYADVDRARLGRIDPAGRQLTVSCGAALLNMRVTAAHLGRAVEVELLPNPSEPTLLATVNIGSRIPVRGDDASLQPAIRRRHTHRRAFAARAVPGLIVRELVEAAHREQAALVVPSRRDREWLIDLVALSEAALADDPDYTNDLAPWTDGNPRRHDGIPPSSFGTTPLSGTPPMRDFARAHPQPSIRRERYPVDPCVALLSTAEDTPLAWLRAGQALQRVLLLATLRGLAASFLNQPLDTEEIRSELFQFGHPQMILRLGYARAAVATPRRPVTDVIRHES